MIQVTDTIEGSGHPLAFRVGTSASRGPLFGPGPGSAVLRVEARAMGGHQKEAVVTEGADGAWRLASDEGPILGGSDLAPPPLGFFCAGLQSDLVARIRLLAPLHDVRLDALAVTVENHFAFTGSFVQGTGRGSTQPAMVAISVRTAAPAAAVTGLLQDAIDASPAMATLRTPLASTFALYVNGKRSNVQGVEASPAGDAVDPYARHAQRLAPAAGASEAGGLVRRLKPSEVDAGALPASGGSASIVVTGHARAAADDMTTIETRLAKPPGSSFALRTDDRPQGDAAPSGLALLSAGISFCYLTQLLRYVKYRNYQVRAIRLVQFNPYSIEGSDPATLQGRAHPVDTHLFLHDSEPDAVMQELLFYSARTCFLHAALASAFEPQVTVSINDGPSLPVPPSRGART